MLRKVILYLMENISYNTHSGVLLNDQELPLYKGVLK